MDSTTASLVVHARSRSTDAELSFDEWIRGNPSVAQESWSWMCSALREQRIMFGDRPLPVSLKPFFVPLADHDQWVARTERLFGALERVARLLLEDRSLYDRLELPPEARELIDIDPGYARFAVFARPDMVWSDNDLWVYEINTDSPAMMSFTDAVQSLLRTLPGVGEVLDRFGARSFDRTRRLLDSMLEVYQEWGGSKTSPTIAVVDWQGEKTALEQEYTARLFTEMGCPAFTCDPRELTVEGGKLLARGRSIDLVQRRVLFPDFVRRKNELAPLVQAIKERAACVVNPLRSYLLGNKALLNLLRRPEVTAALDAGERAEVERTILPTKVLHGVTERLISEQDRWVLKQAFGHGGMGVVIGEHADSSTWRAAVEEASQSSGVWVCQEFRRPPHYRVPLFEGGEITWDTLNANWNPFVFGGRFAGAMTRVSARPIVSITARGALLPSMPVP